MKNGWKKGGMALAAVFTATSMTGCIAGQFLGGDGVTVKARGYQLQCAQVETKSESENCLADVRHSLRNMGEDLSELAQTYADDTEFLAALSTARGAEACRNIDAAGEAWEQRLDDVGGWFSGGDPIEGPIAAAMTSYFATAAPCAEGIFNALSTKRGESSDVTYAMMNYRILADSSEEFTATYSAPKFQN